MEQNIANMESKLQKWKLPKVSKKSVYQMGFFDSKKGYSIETNEGIFSLNVNDRCIRLFDQQAIRRYREAYKYLHVGLVQVGVKPLTREGFNASVLVCLRDKRCLDFNQSLLGVAQSSLDDGPVYFNCYPNIMFFLQDQNVWNFMTLNIRLQNLEMRETSFPVVLICRVCYKCLIDPFNAGSKKSSCRDKSLVFQTNIKKHSVDIPRVIKWSDVQFPEEWKVQEEDPPEKQERPTGRVLRGLDGSIRVQFGRRNDAESSTACVTN